MVWPNRNGFYYVLDRETGQFLLAREFATQSWADGISPDGRPRVKPGSSPSAKGTLVYPGLLGGSNWWSPAYNPDTGLLYVPTMERGTIFFKGKPHFTPGAPFAGSAWQAVSGAPYRTAVRALSVETGELQWEYKPPKDATGKPMRVHQTVPITFALPLPSMKRDRGVPELRQGLAPKPPASGQGRSATA